MAVCMHIRRAILLFSFVRSQSESVCLCAFVWLIYKFSSHWLYNIPGISIILVAFFPLGSVDIVAAVCTATNTYICAFVCFRDNAKNDEHFVFFFFVEKKTSQ